VNFREALPCEIGPSPFVFSKVIKALSPIKERRFSHLAVRPVIFLSIPRRKVIPPPPFGVVSGKKTLVRFCLLLAWSLWGPAILFFSGRSFFFRRESSFFCDSSVQTFSSFD